jgi:hypothetical protein
MTYESKYAVGDVVAFITCDKNLAAANVPILTYLGVVKTITFNSDGVEYGVQSLTPRHSDWSNLKQNYIVEKYVVTV